MDDGTDATPEGVPSTSTGAGLVSLPAEPETVWLYMSALVEADNAAGYKVSILERRLSAIKWVHDTSQLTGPNWAGSSPTGAGER